MLEVEKIADLMTSLPETQVELTGHADATGTAQYNMLLSLQRAEQIAAYLEDKGIDRKRVLVDGKGENAPLAKDKKADGSDAPLGRYINRQVYVKIAGPIPASTDLAGVYVPENLKKSKEPGQAASETNFLYTIQLSAAHTALPMSSFEKVGQVREYHCSDGYYRYASGSYNTFPEATEHLRKVRNSEFEDAFIQTIQWYENAMK